MHENDEICICGHSKSLHYQAEGGLGHCVRTCECTGFRSREEKTRDMDKAELKKTATEAVEKWLESLDNDEYKGMDEFMFAIKLIRCECGQVHFLRILRDYGGDVECDEEEEYEYPKTDAEA